MSLPTGQKIAHYDILEPIGKGGRGSRYELNGPGVSGADTEGGVSGPVAPGDIIINAAVRVDREHGIIGATSTSNEQ
ncbi:MAG: hypothetical protein BMS9Abin37_0991 [Acidobacteriota bacterium]|nr:MAG: hypothetical protein BMS9Abin37_0991 [Acidobacteriota bacterium]